MTEKEEIIYLRALLEQERAEKEVIIRNLKRIFDTLGIRFGEGENTKKNMIKSLTSVFTQMMVNSKGVEEKFSFLSELMPIVEKYQNTENHE